MPSSRLIVCGFCALWCAASSSVSDAEEQGKFTPGSVALLATNHQTPVNAAVLRDVVTDPDASVRRVAARVVGVVERHDLVPLLLEQLAREQDQDAAAEQLRAVLFMRGMMAFPEASAAAIRVGGPARLALAEWLGRREPDRFPGELAGLAKGLSTHDLSELAAISAMAIRQNPSAKNSVTRVQAGLSTGTAWRRFLDSFGLIGPEDGVLVDAGLTAADPAVREETLWFALSQAAHGWKLPLARVPVAVQADTSATDTDWGRTGRELLVRVVEKSRGMDVSETMERLAAEHRRDATRLANLADILTTEERAALRSALGADNRQSIGDEFSFKSDLGAARTFGSISPGLLGSLFKELDCRVEANAHQFGVARVTYLDDGRAATVEVDGSQMPKACSPAVGVLGFLTLADPAQAVRAGETQRLLLPMDRAALACADLPRVMPERVGMPARVGQRRGSIRAPTKTRNVNPVYPLSAQQAGVQGVVILESVIAEAGCVRSSRVIRSIPALDLAALRGVSAWTFTPTLLDSKPVPVIMNVTVSFNLH